MKLVDTETPNPDRFARTADGKIDFDAYKGLYATYNTGELDFLVTILDSRQRFGHLDLLITPRHGAGERWTEFKNLVIHNDPAQMAAAIAVAASMAAVLSPSPEIEAEPESIPEPVAVMTEVTSPATDLAAEIADAIEEQEQERAIEYFESPEPEPVPVPAMPDPGPHGTHWTEVAPQPVAVATQEVEAPASTDMEDEVAAILGDNSPHVK
jgi:hypothetical protein